MEKLRAKFPPGLLELTRLPGLGPKRARMLFDNLGIDSLAALRAAAEAQQLRSIRGLGPRFEQQVIAAIDAGLGERPAPRVLLPRALGLGEQIRDALRAHPAAVRVELGGGVRRLADSVKDLDIVAAAERPRRAGRGAGRASTSSSRPRRAGPNAARGRTHNGMPVDLRVVEPDQFGNLWQHFTGSAAHNVALRELVTPARPARQRVRDPRRRDRRDAALRRPRRRSTRAWGWPGSRPSCARTAASCRRRPPARCPSG